MEYGYTPNLHHPSCPCFSCDVERGIAETVDNALKAMLANKQIGVSHPTVQHLERCLALS